MKARCGGGGKPRRASSSPTNAVAAAAMDEEEEVEEEEAVYRVSCSDCGRPGGRALAKRRTAPAGRVGWRFRRDSLGSHAFLHF